MAQLKFYKSASAPAAAATGAVWFDTTNHTIQVKTATGWDKYAGALNDATWDGLNLTITKHDGSSIVLNFSDFASASGVTAALAGKLAIGTAADAANTQSYYGLKADIAAAKTELQGYADQAEADAKSAVIGKSSDAAGADTVYGAKAYADAAVAAKNVEAEPVNGELVTASAANNKVTVGVTAKLTNAVGLAESALQKTDIVTGGANGTISVEGSDVAVKGLGSAAYTEASAYDAAGAASTVNDRLTETIGTLDSTDAKTLEAINDELNVVDGEISKIKSSIAGGVHFAGVINSANVPTVTLTDAGLVGTWTGNDEVDHTQNFNIGDIIILSAGIDGDVEEPNKEFILCLDGESYVWVELGDLSPADQRLTAIEESYVKSVATTDGTYVKLTPDTAANNAVVVTIDDTAIVAKFQEIEASIEGAVAGSVASIGGQAGTITLLGGQTGNGSVNLTMDGKQLGAAVVGLKSAAFTEASAYDAAGTAAGLISGLDAEVAGTGANGVKVTVTEVDGKITAVAVDDAAVATAESNAKAYADSLLEWALFE